MATTGQQRAEQALSDWLISVGWGTDDAAILEYDIGARPSEHVITLPGERKLRTTCSVLIGPRWTSLSAFVIRKPDENHVEFYTDVLRRSARSGVVAYNVDKLGDVYVRGQIPTDAVTVDLLDDAFGSVLAASDDAFNPLVAIGFASAIERERQWRIKRGESLANLAAFEPASAGAAGGAAQTIRDAEV